MIALRDVTAGYGTTTVVREVDLSVRPGEVVALLGPNGAGKTTLLRVAAGLLRPQRGTVSLAGVDVTRRPPHARPGLCLVPEGRGVFAALTVRENLRLQTRESFEPALEAFPVLAHRLDQRAGSLSGGEQQMLALARCWLARPACVLLDEVSMGLAPLVVDEIYVALARLAQSGVALVVVEQHVDRALALADRVHVLDRGRTAFAGPVRGFDRDSLALTRKTPA